MNENKQIDVMELKKILRDLFNQPSRHKDVPWKERANIYEILVRMNQKHPEVLSNSQLQSELIEYYRRLEVAEAIEKLSANQLTLFDEDDIAQNNIMAHAKVAKPSTNTMGEGKEPSEQGLSPIPRPPFNAEYMLYLLLREEEREALIGDLVEGYARILERFGKGRADFWFYKQVACSVWPLLRRAIAKAGAIVWLGQLLRQLNS